MFFLIKYNREKGKINSLKSYHESEHLDAENDRLKMELSLIRNGLDYEVVILEANSKKDLRKTHSRYFKNLQEIANIK